MLPLPLALVRRHTADEWTVAFCGFSPGFGYLTSTTRVGGAAQVLATQGRAARLGGPGREFSGVYPRESPGGWQLISRTEIAVFDLARELATLLRPGVRVRFVDEARR